MGKRIGNAAKEVIETISQAFKEDMPLARKAVSFFVVVWTILLCFLLGYYVWHDHAERGTKILAFSGLAMFAYQNCQYAKYLLR